MSKKRKNRRILWLIPLFLLALGLAGFLVVKLYHPTPVTPKEPLFPEAYQPEEDQYNFLILGLDHSESLADVLMIVHLDAADASLSLLQLPRDTYYETESGKTKLNASFSVYKKQAEKEGVADPKMAAGKHLAEELSKTLCVHLPYQVLVNLDAFVAAFDTLMPEGLELDIPYDMDYDDPEQDLSIHFKAGPTLLHGKEALEFVRFRSGYALADVGRVDAQKLFLAAALSAMTERLKDAGILKLSQLAQEVIGEVTTNCSLLDSIYFARLATRLDLEKVSMMTAPGEAMRDSQNAWYFQVNRDDLRTAVNLYFNSFDIEVPDMSFDETYALVNESDGALLRLYLDETGKYLKVYNAKTLNENSIVIPQKK